VLRTIRIPLTLLLCAAVVTVFLFARKKSEPTYNGRSLSEWYTMMIRAKQGEVASAQGDEAKKAIFKIGTNAVPYLLQHITYKRPPTPQWERRAYDVPLIGDWFARMRARPGKRADEAMDMFFILGTNAASAVPELTRLVNSTTDPSVATQALCALSAVGDESLPTFITLISDPQHPHRRRALSWVGNISPQTFSTNLVVILPHLVRCSKDPNPYIANLSVKALGRLALQPDFTVPVLINAFQQTTNRSMRMLAAEGLGNFHEQASNAVPILRLATDDPDDHIRFWVTNALQQIVDPPTGPDPLEAN